MQTNSKIWKAENGWSRDSETVLLSKGPKIAVHIQMDGPQIRSSTLQLSDTFCCTGADSSILEWLELYSLGKVSSMLLLSGSSFQQKIMRALCEIPFGKTLSYQDLAKACGSPNGARAAGGACGKNPFPLFVPCHRVIQTSGKLGGFAVDIEIKRRLLEFEAGYF